MNGFVSRREWRLVGAIALLVSVVSGSSQTAKTGEEAPDFEKLRARLEKLRVRWDVPGMSAAIVEKGRIVWSAGFGYAEVASRKPATPDTVYHLASLTKPFAATLLMQLVEAGKLDLDAPVKEFEIELKSDEGVQVRHLLTHTSQGVPGESYRYNGARFAQLDKVLMKVTDKTFAALVSERILEPLNLTNTSPNPQQAAACKEAHREAEVFRRRLAQGYNLDGETVDYSERFSSAAGLVSTVGDMARFSSALDEQRLLSGASLAAMYTPMKASKGKMLPYGLGWFIQRRRGVKLIWHYGWWIGDSTLIVKVPEQKVAFILLANSEGLSRKFDMGKDEDVTRSPFAEAFLEAYGL